jgi:hypothetical protein
MAIAVVNDNTGYRAVPVSVECLNPLVPVETCFGRLCRAVREKFR